jgi:hypothetical protein
MHAEKMPADAADADEKTLYRIGGIAALALGIGYLAIFRCSPAWAFRRLVERRG